MRCLVILLVTLSIAHAEPDLRVGTSYLYAGERRIDEPEFFRIAGKPDLAERVTSRRRIGMTMMIAGGIVSVGGLAICLSQRSSRPLVFTGAGIMCVGVVTIGAGGLVHGNANPYDDAQMKDLARDYNERAKPGVSVAPYVSGDGGGFVASGAF